MSELKIKTTLIQILFLPWTHWSEKNHHLSGLSSSLQFVGNSTYLPCELPCEIYNKKVLLARGNLFPKLRVVFLKKSCFKTFWMNHIISMNKVTMPLATVEQSIIVCSTFPLPQLCDFNKSIFWPTGYVFHPFERHIDAMQGQPAFPQLSSE